MRIWVVVVCLTFARSAWAVPGVIAPSQAKLFSAPSTEASVVAVLSKGDHVCVVEHDAGELVLHRIGWLALRTSGDVAYVPVEAVDVTNVSSQAACPGPPRATTIAALPSATATVAAAPPPPAEVPETNRFAGVFVPLRKARFMFAVGGGVMAIDKTAARRNGLAQSSPAVHASTGVTIYDVFTVSLGFGFAAPTDESPFTQVVVREGDNKAFTASSSVDVEAFSLAVGVRTPFLALAATGKGWVATGLFAEYGAAAIAGHRGISNCSDCANNPIDLPNGRFWRAGLDVLVPMMSSRSAWGLQVAYQRYAAGAGFDHEIHAGLGGWFY